MAANPMKRQARNSFLLGVLVTILIAGVIIAFLFLQMNNLNKELKQQKESSKKVFILNQNVKSGQTLTPSMFISKEIPSDAVPADATSDVTQLIAQYSLCDTSGNDIYTDADGNLYMLRNNNKVTVYKDNATGVFYTQENGNRTTIETTQKDIVAKTDMRKNTVITSSLIARSDHINSADVREQEYNMIVLPIDLTTGEYVDIRLQLPTGQDYIVVSKKEVTVPDVAGSYLADTIKVKLAEEETLALSSAIIEAYKMNGSKLYATKYVEAGIQETAIPTYVVNNDVANLIESDPNIVTEAKNALRARYTANNSALMNLRNQYINSALSTYGNNDNVPTKMQESIVSTKEKRQEYLQSLGGTAPTK